MLRSITQAYASIKAEDKDTAVTAHTIRLWIKEGKIKTVTVGTKILVDMESLKNLIG